MSNSIRLTTPKGIAQYPWLNKPDTKFNENGEYKVNLIVPKDNAESFCKKIVELRDEAFALSKNKKKAALPFEKELNDQGDETGNIIIKCKVKNHAEWDRKPKLFDAKGSKTDVNIGGGSTLKANVQVYAWDVAKQGVGVMLQPVAVQIIDLVSFGSNSAEDFGFGEEDGFVTSDREESFEDEVDTHTTQEDADLF